MERLRSRLALRIYLAGLAQIAAVILGFFVFMEAHRAYEGSSGRDAHAAVEAVAAKLGDDAAVAGELEHARRTQDATIVIYDPDGQVLASNRPAGEAPPFLPPWPGPMPPRPHGLFPPPPPGPPMPAFMIPVRLPDGRTGRAFYASTMLRPPPRHELAIVAIVLIVVGVASWLTARSLVRPLARLSRAARALGKGQLDARVGLSRSDEIGEVAAAFDEMADRLTALLRAEKELLANVSHELRTPLARIRVALDIAAEGDGDTARELLGDIAGDLGELERLISDVLTAARLDLGDGAVPSGIPPLRHEHVEAAGLCDNAAARFRSAHPERALTVDLGPELPALEGDPVLLRRVIDNLLENAHKYSPRAEDGVELSARASKSELTIEVRDRGIGIAAEDVPHIFRPFFRADRSRTRATGGLGLGLALARRIVEAHHGSIEVESRVGEGTTMRVRLPVVAG